MKWFTFLILPALAAAETTELTSPDGRNLIRVELSDSGEISYSVLRDEMQIIGSSPLGLIAEDGDFSKNLRQISEGKVATVTESYRLISGNKREIQQQHRRQQIIFENSQAQSICLEIDAGNEGVAFRYRFNEPTTGTRVIRTELTGFKIPESATGWIAPYNSSSDSSPAYEDYYFKTKPGDPPPASRGGATRGWYFPALFELANGKWILLTESGTRDNYPGCHLSPNSTDGVYQIAFPFEDEITQGVKFADGTSPRSSLPWTMPWRVIVLGDSAADIATTSLVTDLAPSREVDDLSWIKPGRSSWSWWAHPENLNRAETTSVYDAFLKSAADFGWEYTLLDAGWWQTDMERMKQKAEESGVALLGWTHANDFYDPQKRADKLDELKQLGFTGVKIDFWCSDRQETMAAIDATLKEAADRHLLVNLHGCPLPRGWQRTHPNLISAEAVLGTESYMFDERFPEMSAELNTLLPFTRNVVGPMDYTPLGLGKKSFPRLNSAAHELATALIFNSGIIHFADEPKVFETFPDTVKSLLANVRPTWDETRFLISRPGELVVVARRLGKSWFISGISALPEPQTIPIDLTPFGENRDRKLIHEGDDPLMGFSVQSVDSANLLTHTIPSRGGFVLWLHGTE